MSPLTLRLRDLRRAKGWSQTELGTRAGVRQATISAIEQEKTKGVEFDVLEKLAIALDVDPRDLIHYAHLAPKSREKRN